MLPLLCSSFVSRARFYTFINRFCYVERARLKDGGNHFVPAKNRSTTTYKGLECSN